MDSYDPSTGRFLNRSAKPQQTNPYVPWSGDPTGMLVAPLSLLGLLLGKKKKRGKWELVAVILVLGLSLGMSLTACNQAITAEIELATETPMTMPPTPTAIKINIGGETEDWEIWMPEGFPVDTPELRCTIDLQSQIIPTPIPIQIYDILDESLLRGDTLEKNTNTNGKEYYDWYKILWNNKSWWWWDKHTSFSTWDLFTLIIHIEIDVIGNPAYKNMYEGFPIYKEALVRTAYQWCKEQPPYQLPNTPQGALNWLAAYNESSPQQAILLAN